MNKIEIGPKIVVYKNIDSNPMSIIDDANKIIQEFPSLGFKAATINNHEYNTDLRSCTVFSLNTESANHRTYRDWETDRKSTRLNSSHRL